MPSETNNTESARPIPAKNIFKHRYDPLEKNICDAHSAVIGHVQQQEAILHLLLSQLEDVDDDQRVSDEFMIHSIYSLIAGLKDIVAIVGEIEP